MIGSRSPLGGGLNASMMGGPSHVMGAADEDERRFVQQVHNRKLVLTPGGWLVDGRLVGDPEWQPEPGERVQMIGPDAKGYWARDMGMFEWRGRPPAKPGLANPFANAPDNSLPGMIGNLFRLGSR